jgi:hypothetical protein
VPAALLQHDTQVVPNEGEVPAIPDDGAKSGFGRIEPTRRQVRDAFRKTRSQRRRQDLPRRSRT